MGGTEAEHLTGALDRLRATFHWKADELNAAGLQARVGASTLTLGGLLKHLALVEGNGVDTQGQETAMPQVREFMTSEVVSIEPSASIVDAATKMIQQEKGPLPVVEGTKAVAMVTDRDIIARVVAAGKDPGSVRVEDIATKELVTISPDAEVDAARQLMAQHQLDRILVVEGDTLVGIISEADIRRDEGPLA